jgi:hypothetical protein
MSKTNSLRLGKTSEVGISRNEHQKYSFFFNGKAGIFRCQDHSVTYSEIIALYRKDPTKHVNKRWEKDSQCTYKRNSEARSRNHYCRGKAKSITYSECVFVALFIQMQRVCAVLYCHLWPVWPYHIFPHYLLNCMIFVKKSIIIYVF